jgi:general secretion pathway protein C
MSVDAYVKRYFWLGRVALVVICSGLSATAVSHVVAATALAETAEPRRPPVVRPPAPPPDGARSLSAAGVALVERNIFCSDCVRLAPSADASAAGPGDPAGPPVTDLPLRLVATTLSRVEGRSFATFRNTSSAKQGAYRVGESIPGAGPVRRIAGTYVDFENRTAARVERITFAAPPPPAPAPSRPTVPPPAGKKGASANDELLAAVDAGVRQLDDDSYEVDRSVVAKLLANPTAAARGARIVPSVKDGKPNGFKIYRIRSTSVYGRIGFKNGDTIHSINGFELTSMDKALEVYTKVREASSLSVTVTRRGKPMTLDYTIR